MIIKLKNHFITVPEDFLSSANTSLNKPATLYWIHRAHEQNLLTEGWVGVTQTLQIRFNVFKYNMKKRMPEVDPSEWILEELFNADEAFCYAVEAILRPDDHIGLNKRRGGYRQGGVVGTKYSDETKKRISTGKKGRKQSPEHIAARAAARRGRKLSDETRAKMSATRKGRKFSEEHKAALSAAHKARIELKKAEQQVD